MCSGSGIYHIATKLYFRVKGMEMWPKWGISINTVPSECAKCKSWNCPFRSGSEFRSVKVSPSSWEIPHVSITSTITAVWDTTQEPQQSPLFPKVRRSHNCESPNLLWALPEERVGTPAVTEEGGGVWCLDSTHCSLWLDSRGPVLLGSRWVTSWLT